MIRDGSSWDVLVVGAGPGGSWAANSSAKSGAKTLLVEKRPVIGTPVRCAEGMTREMLQAVGMEPREEWVTNTFAGAKLVSPSGHIILVDSSKAGNVCGWAMDRERFDMDLSLMAAESGAAVHSDTAVVNLERNGGGWKVSMLHWGRRISVQAKVVVAADGFESQVGRWAGLDTTVPGKDVISGLEYTLSGIKGDHRFMEFYFDHALAPGAYAWVFWKGEGAANVGLGVSGDRLMEPGEVERRLNAFIRSRPGMENGRIRRRIAGGIPVSKPLKRTVGDGILLVGDAARVTDPMHGGGITNAMLTGEMAGRISAEYAGNGCRQETLEAYEKEWRGRLESELYKHYIVKEYIARMSNDQLDASMAAFKDVVLDSLEPSSLINNVVIGYPKVLERIMKVVSG